MSVLVWEGHQLLVIYVEHEISRVRRWSVYEAPWLSQSKDKQLEGRGAETLTYKVKYNNDAPSVSDIDALVKMIP